MKDFDADAMHDRGFNLMNDNPEMRPTLEQVGDYLIEHGIDPETYSGFTFEAVYPVIAAMYYIGVDTGYQIARNDFFKPSESRQSGKSKER